MIKGNIIIDSLIGLMIMAITVNYVYSLISIYSKLELNSAMDYKLEVNNDCELWCNKGLYDD